ncbi:MAG: PilZ domain-containing protein [Gammaproteobacteria bacterium]|nr:PilZ domain-containing protein [Gammaproteobacteria bacterium]MCP5298472.1 PilZ domain-containing protein [Chromatiaceae bacterium]
MSRNDQLPGRAEDRRNFFRVDDTVRLSLRRVSADQVDRRFDELDHDLAGNFTVMSSLAAITAQMAMSLRRIENRDADMAAYLRAIDQKIEVIGRAFITQEPEFQAEQAVAANLSAGGMCVGVDENYEAGSMLEIRMLLFPSFTGLLIYGSVIDTEPAAESDASRPFSHVVRIEFTHIRETDRELLIRHLLRRQSQQLRARHEEDSQ